MDRPPHQQADTPLLALDTSTTQAALSVFRLEGDQVVVGRPDPTVRHGRTLVPAIQSLLAEAHIDIGSLGGLIVGLGPGSYTGLRIGLTVAKTLSYALGKGLATFDSLEAVARNAPKDALRVAVIGDAQRGDLYAAEFHRTAPGGCLVRESETRVVSREEWTATVQAGTFVLGPALLVPRLAGVVPSGAVTPDDPGANLPQPETIATLAREIWRSGQRSDPWFLEPVYLRRSAAEEQWDRLKTPPAVRSETR